MDEVMQMAAISVAYSMLKDHQKSLWYNFRALRILSGKDVKETYTNHMLRSQRLMDIGSCYGDLNRKEPAEHYHLKGLELLLLYKDSAIARENIQICCANLVEVYLALGKLNKASDYLKLGFTYANPDAEDIYPYAILQEAKADYLHATGKNKEAITIYEQLLATADYSYWYDVKEHLYKSIYESYKTAGNYKKALYYLEKRDVEQAAFDSLSSIDKLNQMQQVLNIQKGEIQLKSVLKEKQNGETLLVQEKKLNLLLIIVALLILILFTSYFYISVKRKNFIKTLKQKNATIRESRRKLAQYNAMLLNEKQDLETENILARFEVLKNQLHPHFLFNALHVLSTLIKQQSKSATEYLHNLVNILRYSLKINRDLLISLDEELVLASSYIELFAFSNRQYFTYRIDVSEQTRNLLIPPFTVQIIVENIFKHNIISSRFPLHLSIRTNQNELIIQHQINKKTGIEKEESFEIGLTNIKKRYEILKAGQPVIEMDHTHFKAILPLLGSE